jgi:hypothetical protein
MTVQSSRAGLTPDSLRRQAASRELCQAHGGALVAIAQLVLDDAQSVSEVVAEAIAAECHTHRTTDVGSSDTRQRLARAVFERSRARPVTRERAGEPAIAQADTRSGELPSVLGRLSADVRATVALTMFGRHGLSEAAAVLNISAETVLGQLREALTAANESAGAVALPGWDVAGLSTGDSRRRRPRRLAARERFAGQDWDAPADRQIGPPAARETWPVAIPAQQSRTDIGQGRSVVK